MTRRFSRPSSPPRACAAGRIAGYMPLSGEYEPSPRAVVRGQVETYERTGDRRPRRCVNENHASMSTRRLGQVAGGTQRVGCRRPGVRKFPTNAEFWMVNLRLRCPKVRHGRIREI